MFRAKLAIVGLSLVLSAGCGGGSAGGITGAGGGPGRADVAESGDAVGAGGATSPGGADAAGAGSGGAIDVGGKSSAADTSAAIDGGNAGAPGMGGSMNEGGAKVSLDGAAGAGGAGVGLDASDAGAAPDAAIGNRDAAGTAGADGAVDVGTDGGVVASPWGTCFAWKVSPDLFVNTLGPWQGWAWARSGGGSNISPIDASGGALCVNGTVAAAGDVVSAGVGFDLDYPRSATGATMMSLTGKGLSYRIRNTGASPLVIKLSGPDTADINNEWCRALPASSGTISDSLTYSMLTPQACGRGSKVTSSLLHDSVVSVSVAVAPATGAATPFSYCVESLTEYRPVQCIDESNTPVPIVGATWTRRGTTQRWETVASSADGMKLVAGSSGGGAPGDYLYTSADRGVTWTQRGPQQPWTSVASSADGSKLVAGACNGWLHTSTDSGLTWTLQGQGVSRACWAGVASSIDGVKLVAVSSGLSGSSTSNTGYVYTSTDSGLTWVQRGPPKAWRAVASSADGTHLVAAEFSSNVYTSADSGETWRLASTHSFISLAISPDGLRIIGGGNSTTDYLYASSDFGATWTQMASPQPTWTGIAMSSDGTRILASVGQDPDGALHLSKDSGLTWTSPDPIWAPHLWWAAVASSNDGRSLVAVLDTDRIFTSSGALLP